MRRRLLATLFTLASSAAAGAPLTTHAERSGFTQTGRHAEVESLCTAYAQHWPEAVRCETFGRTPEGRPMLALVASRSGALTAADARRRGTPVLLVQGGIHAGEIDGKDAGFLALREMLEGTAAKDALERVVVVFVPVFNVDGHERMGRWNRPNQRGPEEMGWRTTAQNLNLNRDYVKADAPEMQAMLRLVEAWDPIAYTDLHVTDGAQFEHDISINLEPSHSGDAGLRKAGVALRDALLADLARQGSLPLPFYPSFVEYDNPASGFEDNVATPRFSHGYFPLRNRFGVLVETHSWKDYPTRVRITRNTIVALVEHTAKDGARWRALATKADADAAKLGGTTVPLDYKATDKVRTIAFRGYAYTRTPSEVSGALMTRYDERTPQVWNIPLRDDVQPHLQVTAPRGGYIVPPAHAALVSAWLTRHGITFRTLGAARPSADVEVFRATQATFGTGTVEGHQRLALEGSWQREPRDVQAGALYVPIAQPKARLVVAILEPQAPDSIAAWGGFNTAFERKEYMEEYVAEDVARTMLRDDPAVAKAFNERLATDEAFARNPAARLEFFARRHSSWDEQYNLYPVMRCDVEPR